MSIEIAKDLKEFQDFELEGWETSSAGYDRHWAGLTQQSAGPTLDAAGVADGMRVLDVCCGPAMLAAGALDRGAQTVGLDFSPKVVAIARSNVPGAEFHEGDAQALPFDDDSFDAVVCGYGIIHVPDPAAALGEMRRVLKPGGRLAVSVWEAPGPANGFGVLFGALKTAGDLNVPLPHGPDFFQFSDEGRMTAALEEAGLGHVSVQTVQQIWVLDEPLGIIRAVLEGTVRARALLLAQAEDARRAVEATVTAGMDKFGRDDGMYVVPMPALVGAGTK